MEISVSTLINAPKEVVWGHITDIVNCSEMISGIIDLKVLDKPSAGHVGLKWEETREMFGKEAKETMWITESVENDFYKTRAENHGAIYITKMSVQTVDDQTKLTMAFSGTAQKLFVKLITKLMGLMMKGSMKKLLERDLADIKDHIESRNNI